MYIDDTHSSAGNRAMASVLLLYYHLLREGGITNDQTVYVDVDEFDAFAYLTVDVSLDQGTDVDQTLLREGAVVYLLCDLNDMVSEHETDYLEEPFVQRIVDANAAGRLAAIPEAAGIVEMVSAGESHLEYAAFAGRLHEVYERYVLGRFKALVRGSEA